MLFGIDIPVLFVLFSQAIALVIIFAAFVVWRKAKSRIEEQERTKQALLSRTQELQAILSSMGEGIIVVDTDFRISLMNQTASVLLRVAPFEAMQKQVFEVFPVFRGKEQVVETRDLLWKVMEQPDILNIRLKDDYYCRNKAGGIFSIAMVAASLMRKGEIGGVIIAFHDIQEEKDIDRAKTEFVSLASHQLSTPLSTVNWYAEMLLAGDAGKLNKEQKKYVDEVYRGTQRMVELVNALLNVSRLELGTFAVEPKPTDIGKLVQSAIDEQSPQINGKGLRVETAFDNAIPLVPADPKLLRMVVQNLLSNAVKYTPQAGTIGVSLSLNSQKNVLLKVSDTGYGIPKSQHDKIFTKLFRADNVREKDTEGTGLGLYVVKAIIDQSGGAIWFESEENKGTTFYVTVPLAGMKKKEGVKSFA